MKAGFCIVVRVEAGVGGVRTVRAPEHVVDEVVVSVSPIAGVVGVGPKGVVEDVRIGVRPEHRAKPRHERRVMATPPGLPGSPAALAGRERGLGLRTGLLAKARGKSPTLGGLRGGGGCCGALRRSR